MNPREIYAPAAATKQRLQETTETGLLAWFTGMLETLKNGNGSAVAETLARMFRPSRLRINFVSP